MFNAPVSIFQKRQVINEEKFLKIPLKILPLHPLTLPITTFKHAANQIISAVIELNKLLIV